MTASRPATEKSTQGLTIGDVVQGFQGTIQPVRVGLGYRLTLLAVALAMVLLPLVYVGLIGLAGYGVYYHATENVSIFNERGSVKGKIFIYVTPIVVGGILVLFMIKPLFARRVRQFTPLSLVPQKEPLLFAFVEQVCKAVGAPFPRRIDVDCEVNASASFRRGLLSFFGNDLVLTLGLPLMAGLTLRQFAGVLAHELGHFAQGGGMRCTYIIRSVSAWFARVVYERDSWDAWLEATSKETDIRIGIVFYLSRLFIWLTRRILWVLMFIGDAISCSMLRHMEYDADRYEMRVAGSGAFCDTFCSVRLLGVAFHHTMVNLGNDYEEGRLSDDLSQMVMAKVSMIPEEARKEITAASDSERTGLLDTHPSDRDRIRRAGQESAAGIFQLDGPAASLLPNFSPLSRAVTVKYYMGIMGPYYDKEKLIQTEKLVQEHLKEQKAQEEENRALARYHQDTLVPFFPLFAKVKTVSAPKSPKQALTTLREARKRFEEAAPKVRQAQKHYGEADVEILKALGASACLEAELKVNAERFNLPQATAEAIKSKRTQHLREQERLKPGLEAFTEVCRLRLISALELLRVPEVIEKVSSDGKQALADEANSLLAALSAVEKVYPQLIELLNDRTSFLAMVSEAEDQGKGKSAAGTIQRYLLRMRKAMVTIQEGLTGTRYPFEHHRDGMTLVQFALTNVPDREDFGGIVNTSKDALDRLFGLYYRTHGRLAMIAEKVEQAVGLPPLTAPAREQPS